MLKTAMLRTVAVAATVALVAAGCGSSGSDDNGQVEITIAVGWGDVPAVAAAFRGVVANFESAHPEIRVNLEESGSSAYSESISLRAASANPPDAFMLSTAVYGPGFYNLVMGGHLAPLDEYAQQRGWIERFSSNEALNPFRVDRTSGVAGTGALYGLPQQRTLLGVYYNKKLLSGLGFTAPPTTMAAFEQTLAAAKGAGVTPVAATKDAYVHNQMVLWVAAERSAEPINDWIYGVSGTFGSATNTRSLELLVDWQAKGYLQEGSIGVSYAGAVSAFTSGEALYIVAGPWLSGTVNDTLGADAGFMRMPGVAESTPIGGGPSSPLVLSARARHPAEAVEFLDFFNSQSQSDFLMAQGWGPPGAILATTQGNPLDVQIEAILSQAEADGLTIVPYINWASPTVDSNIYSGLESLLSGQSSVADYVGLIQSAWAESKGERGGS